MSKTKTMPGRVYLDRRAVKLARIASGYDSGQRVAERLGVPSSTYYSWELGTCRIPEEQLWALARLLGARWASLVYGA